MIGVWRRIGLPIGVAAWLAAAGPAAADVDALRALVAKKSGILKLLHDKAERALVTAAQDQTFRDYFAAESATGKSVQRERIDQLSLAVQRRFAVEEMCTIDQTGTEISRIVGREVARDLATDEANAIFFEPGFAQEPRSVYTSPIYMSADADRWVMAYVTPIVADGEKQAILHYEHGLDYYQGFLQAGLSPSGPVVLQAVTEDGWVVFDSRKAIPIDKKAETEDPADYFESFSLDGLTLADLAGTVASGSNAGAGGVTARDQDYHVAFAKFGDWTLVAHQPGNQT